jgi:hypothetical protein
MPGPTKITALAGAWSEKASELKVEAGDDATARRSDEEPAPRHVLLRRARTATTVRIEQART